MKSEVLKRQGYSVAAMRSLARRTLPKTVFDFADGGAEDERTLTRNESAFHEITFLPRPLRGVHERDQSIMLFGSRLKIPVIVGPTGLAGLFWPDGELCAARAASSAETAYCLSHGSICTLEDLARLGTSPRWMQVFIYRDRGFTRELVARATNARFDALVLTVDNQLTGNRERDIRNGFMIPPRLDAFQMISMATKLPWLWRMRKEFRRITFGNYVRPGEKSDIRSLAGRMPSLLDPTMNWDDVEELRKLWKGPFILKGILHPDDAPLAIERGVDGIIVSNHGGRQLDGAETAVLALRRIVERVDRRIPVLLDGGIRRGADVIKAISLGATACLIGRPQLWGLAVAGEEGVTHVLDIYRREIDRVMGLLGVSRLSDLGAEFLAWSQGSAPLLKPTQFPENHLHRASSAEN